ncbi:MAG: iron ABC transporter substrate-binding protein [Chloroflexi bacterium]|nr:iron ABC transporter substrate-binding protein [Chloroflexota bacterium]
MGRHMIVGIMVTVLAVVAAGCGQGRDTLTIYSGRSEALVEPIIEQFRESTGIKVAVRYASTSELTTTLLEEGRRSPADIFFAQDPGGLGAVEEMFAPLPDGILSRVPEWGRSPEGMWVGISGRARTVVYNTERLTETDLPDDIWDFTDPQWKGRVGWAPRNGSFQTMVSAMRFTWGAERTRQWLEGMHANDPQEYANNTSQVVAVAAGEVDVGLVNHYYLHRFLAEEGESFDARNYYPRAGGPGSLIMVAGAGILASSDHREDAEQFLEFMLSRDAQQYFADETFEYPLVEGVEAQRGLVALSEIRNPTVPMKELADLEGTQAMLRELGIIS